MADLLVSIHLLYNVYVTNVYIDFGVALVIYKNLFCWLSHGKDYGNVLLLKLNAFTTISDGYNWHNTLVVKGLNIPLLQSAKLTYGFS